MLLSLSLSSLLSFFFFIIHLLVTILFKEGHAVAFVVRVFDVTLVVVALTKLFPFHLCFSNQREADVGVIVVVINYYNIQKSIGIWIEATQVVRVYGRGSLS